MMFIPPASDAFIDHLPQTLCASDGVRQIGDCSERRLIIHDAIMKMDNAIHALKTGAIGRMSQWIQGRFELSRGIEGTNVRPMEGMRGLAVFLVFLVHYITLIMPWLEKKSVVS